MKTVKAIFGVPKRNENPETTNKYYSTTKHVKAYLNTDHNILRHWMYDTYATLAQNQKAVWRKGQPMG